MDVVRHHVQRLEPRALLQDHCGQDRSSTGGTSTERRYFGDQTTWKARWNTPWSGWIAASARPSRTAYNGFSTYVLHFAGRRVYPHGFSHGACAAQKNRSGRAPRLAGAAGDPHSSVSALPPTSTNLTRDAPQRGHLRGSTRSTTSRWQVRQRHVVGVSASRVRIAPVLSVMRSSRWQSTRRRPRPPEYAGTVRASDLRDAIASIRSGAGPS